MCSQNDDPSQHASDDTLRSALDPYQLLHDGGFPWDDVNAIAAILDHYGLDIVPALAASATDEPKGTLRAARRDLLDIMRRMDCQDLFDDAFYALVRYERAAIAASALDEDIVERMERETDWESAASEPKERRSGRDRRAVLAASATDEPKRDTLRAALDRHFGPTYQDAIEAVMHEYAASATDEPWTAHDVEYADGRVADYKTRSDDTLRAALDENQLFAVWPEEDVHYEYEDSPEREPILFVRWDHMWSRIRAALAASATDEPWTDPKG